MRGKVGRRATSARTIIVREAGRWEENKWNLPLLSVIVAGLPLVYYVFTMFYLSYYRSECSEFYGIPRAYFNTDTNEKVNYLLCAILLLSSVFLPLILHNMYTSKRDNKKGLSIAEIAVATEIGLVFGIVVGYYAAKLVSWFLTMWHVDRDYSMQVMLAFILLDIFMVFATTFHDRLIGHIHLSRCLLFVSSYIFAVSVLIFIFGMGTKLSAGIDKKQDYEFARCGNNSYAVLSVYDGKLLVVPYEENESGVCFLTGNYYLMNASEVELSYRQMENPPKINKDSRY